MRRAGGWIPLADRGSGEEELGAERIELAKVVLDLPPGTESAIMTRLESPRIPSETVLNYVALAKNVHDIP